MINIDNMIDAYGSVIKILNDNDSLETRAFIEPLRYKNRMYDEYKKDSYLLVCKPNINIRSNMQIEWRGFYFDVAITEKYILKEKEIYSWGIIMPHKEYKL